MTGRATAVMGEEADADAPPDVMFVGRRRPPRPGMNSIITRGGGGGETLDPLPQGAFLTGVSLLGGESSGHLSATSASAAPRPPSGSHRPLPPPPGDLDDPHLDQESRAELEALRSMWCSDPYSGEGKDGAAAAESALLVRNLITQAEEVGAHLQDQIGLIRGENTGMEPYHT